MRRLAASVLIWSLAAFQPAVAEQRDFIRLGGEAFGDMAVLEVPADVDQEVIREAFRRLREVERLTERRRIDARTAIQELNDTAGTGPQTVEPVLARLLSRAQSFCIWSEGKIGPLGGAVYDLWELGDGIPTPEALQEAIKTTECSRLAVDVDSATVTLARGSRIDLRHFAAGHAIDEAISALRDRKVDTAAVAVGNAVRAYGRGPAARSWPFELPAFTGLSGAGRTVTLAERAVAWSDPEPRIRVGQEGFSTHLNQRTGRLASPDGGVVVVSELAVDAVGLTHAMFVMGSRVGQMYLGGLKPPPSVLWVLGTGEGPAVHSSHNWSRLRRP